MVFATRHFYTAQAAGLSTAGWPVVSGRLFHI